MATESPKGIPARRVRDIAAARTIHEDLKKRDETANKIRAQVRNQIDGGLPTDPAKLTKQNRKHEANANFGVARSDFERARSPFFRLIFDAPRKTSVVIHTKYEEPNATSHQAAVEAAIDCFYDDWGQDAFIENLAFQSDYVAFGVGVAYFDKPKSPRWKCVSRGSVRVPRRSKINAKQIPLIEIDEAFSIADLYGYIANEEDAKLAGWNVEMVKRLIAHTLKHGGEGEAATDDWEKLQDRIRDNDLGCSVPSDTIACVTHLVLERNGKVSKRTFTEDQPKGSDGKPMDDGYIFEDEDFAESMDQVIRLGIFEVPLGDRSVHGIKGQGQKNYAHARIDNRFRNKLLNAVDISIGMNFKRTSTDIKDFPVARFGDTVNVFNQGLEQLQYWPNIQPAVALLGMFEQNRAQVGAQYHQASAQIADSNTARQATILAGIESQISQDSAFLFLSQMSGLFAEQVRRLRIKDSDDPDAKAFQAYLKDRGVPDETIFKAKWTVKASAAAGGATPWARQDAIARWLQLVGHPLVDDRYVLEQAAAQDFGPAGVSKAIVPDADPSQQAQARAAIQEQIDMGQGVVIPVVKQDDHAVHIAKHMELLAAMVTQFQQSGTSTPQKAMVAGILSQHIEQHFEFLNANKNASEVRKRLHNPFQAMAGRVANMIAAAKQQAQQQPPTLAPV